MSAYQLVNYVGIPLTVLLVAVVLVAFARPDRTGDGTYVAYLGFAQVFSLYALLLALATTAETVAQRIALGDPGTSPAQSPNGVTGFALSALGGDGDLAPAFAAGALALVMIVVFVFHARRRGEIDLRAEGVAAVDRAYRGSVCFAMVTLALTAALGMGLGGYRFLDRPVGISDRVHNLAGFELVIYGALLIATFVIFRAHFWDIRPGRGNDEADGGVATVEDLGA